MMQKRDMVAAQTRIPSECKAWLAFQAQLNCSTEISEVVRAIRERMLRVGPAPILPTVTPPAPAAFKPPVDHAG
jgi:hypothetical protein